MPSADSERRTDAADAAAMKPTEAHLDRPRHPDEPAGDYGDVPVCVIEPRRGWLDIGLGEAWRSRQLIRFFVWRDVKVKYKQTLVGVGWAIIQPLAMTIVFSLFIGRLAGRTTSDIPRPLFYYSGLVLWLYFATSVNESSQSLVLNQRVITKVYFPRALLPFSAIVSGGVDLTIAVIPLIGMLVYYGIEVTRALLLAPVFIVLTAVVALAIGLWMSALCALYRDLRYAVPFMLQFWLFCSPVLYSASILPAGWRWVYGLNPLAGTLEGFRWSLTGQDAPSTGLMLTSFSVVAAVLMTGLLYFGRKESAIIDAV